MLAPRPDKLILLLISAISWQFFPAISHSAAPKRKKEVWQEVVWVEQLCLITVLSATSAASDPPLRPSHWSGG